MNWRSRPLTSHEVIINTIAATTTRTGLRVHAELDTRAYDTGAQVSDQQMTCLPLDRHGWHGDWNYTLRPEPPAPPPLPAPPAREPEHTAWAHPALTGMAPAAWDQMITTLTLPHQLQRGTRLYLHRGGPPTRKPSSGHPPALTLAEQVLVTILRLRFRTPRPALTELFGVTPGTLDKAEREIRPLLDQYGYHFNPAPAPLKTLPSLTAYARAHSLTLTPKTKPAR